MTPLRMWIGFGELNHVEYDWPCGETTCEGRAKHAMTVEINGAEFIMPICESHMLDVDEYLRKNGVYVGPRE